MNSRYRAWPSAMSALIALATSGTTVAQTARLVADINLR